MSLRSRNPAQTGAQGVQNIRSVLGLAWTLTMMTGLALGL